MPHFKYILSSQKYFKFTTECVIFIAMGPISRIMTSQVYAELDGQGQAQLTAILKRHVKQLAVTCIFIDYKKCSLYYDCFTNYVHSSALTKSLLPSISPLPVRMFSTLMSLPWYNTSIAPPLASMFSTPMGFPVFTKLPCLLFYSAWTHCHQVCSVPRRVFIVTSKIY